MALIQVLLRGKGKTITGCSDSQYAFAIAHVHRALSRERALLTIVGKEMKNNKNKEETLALLEATWLPKEVAAVPC